MRLFSSLGTTWLLVLVAAMTSRAAEPPVDFSRQIKPILAEKCLACHGPDEGTRKAGLRLDTREGALAEIPRTGSFVHGPACRAGVEAVAAYCGVEHAVGCASGSDALLLPLMALEVGRGDEVLSLPIYPE